MKKFITLEAIALLDREEIWVRGNYKENDPIHNGILKKGTTLTLIGEEDGILSYSEDSHDHNSVAEFDQDDLTYLLAQKLIKEIE